MSCGNDCSCKKNTAEETFQDNSRKNFLKTGLTVGLGAAAILAGCNTHEKGQSANNNKVKVLTHDGQLLEVERDSVTNIMPVINADEARIGIPGKKFVMVIDLAKCDGCGKCTKACNKMHYLPNVKQWIEVLELQDAPETSPYYFPKPCMHCDNPPCTKVCPVDATFKREDGIVAIDTDRCIGCRFCMAACPYSVRLFNWDEPAKPDIVEFNNSSENAFQSKKGCVEKCDFCPHVTRHGEMPACVTHCPMNAIWFGDANEDAVTRYDGTTTKLSQLLTDGAAYRFMEELGTEPRVYYLPPTNRTYDPKEIKVENVHSS